MSAYTQDDEFKIKFSQLKDEQKQVVIGLINFLYTNTVEAKPLQQELNILKGNFEDMSKAVDYQAIVPITYDTLHVGMYIWHNKSKRYVKVQNVYLADETGKRRVKLDDCLYYEDELIGHFFKYDFNW